MPVALRHLLLWALLALAGAMTAGLWTTPAERAVQRELWEQRIRTSLAPAVAARVIERACAGSARASGTPRASVTGCAPSVRLHAPAEPPLRLALLRAWTVAAWWPLLCALAIAAAVQGSVIGRMRATRFAAIDPARQRRWLHGLICCSGSAACATAWPLPLPAWGLPALAGLAAACIAGVCANRVRWRA